MIIGLPKEIKDNESRVGLTAGAVKALTRRGHRVLVEAGAGLGSSISDEEYRVAGAEIVVEAASAWGAQMVVKVKEPIELEYRYLREDLTLFTYLHLAADRKLTYKLLEKRVTAIAYETVQLPDGRLPLLQPMSEVAGRMAVQVGATCLEKERGGKGVLLGGVPGTRRGRVVILGGGVVGRNAATIAIGMGAQVTVLDIRAETMGYLEDVFGGAVETLYSNASNVEETVRRADLVVGAVLVTGAVAPKLVTKELIAQMEPGSVVVDVAVDQGGCIETCRPTNHDHPTYEVHRVVHYCVPNMPGAVSQTSTWALTNTTLGYCEKIANHGFVRAVRGDAALALGVNTYAGHVTYGPVAQAHGMPHETLSKLLPAS